MRKNGESWVEGARKIGEDVRHATRNVWLVGMGTMAVAREQSTGWYDDLRKKGEEFENSEDNLVGRATEQAKKVGETVERRVRETVGATLHRVGVPDRDEVRMLIDRVERLSRKVDALGAKTAS